MSANDDQVQDPDQVQVTVDAEACIAGGQCEMLEPGVFQVDDDTAIAVIIGEPHLPLSRAEIVIDRCPSSAISIVTTMTGDSGAV